MAAPIRALLVTLLCAGWSVVGLSAAAAAAPVEAPGTGLLRVAHLSPDTPSVDVSVQSVSSPGAVISLPGVGYGTVSAYRGAPAGTYAVSIRGTRTDPAAPPALSTTVEVAAGTARTVAAVGQFADLRLTVLDEDLVPPPPGQARVRVVAAAASVDAMDVSLGGTPVVTGLGFARTSEVVDVPAGQADLRITPAGGAPTGLPVEVRAGAVYTVLVLDRSGGGTTVQMVLDAAAPGVVPVGGVETGAGGTAAGRGVPPLPLVLAGTAAALLLTDVPRRARRVRPHRDPVG
jgi:hypothetical protein